MRFKLTLKVRSDFAGYDLLPINYQFDLSEWVASSFNSPDETGFQEFLQNHKLVNNEKIFRFYSFSNLLIPKYKLIGDRLQILSNDVYFYLSIFPVSGIDNFVPLLFKGKTITLEDKKSRTIFTVENVERMREHEFSNEIIFRSMSPILVCYKDNSAIRYTEYMFPKGEKYNELFFSDLIQKIKATRSFLPRSFVENISLENKIEEWQKTISSFKLEVLGSPKSRYVTVRTNPATTMQLRGYLFPFKIKAPKELILIGYFLGFGEENTLGFGYCEING